jgi:putative transposon-encoded protein
MRRPARDKRDRALSPWGTPFVPRPSFAGAHAIERSCALNLKLRIHGIALLGMGLASCGMPPGDEDENSKIEQTPQNALIDLNARPWPRGRVNVCFLQSDPVPEFAAFSDARTRIITALQNSWEKAADIKFSFDTACSTHPLAVVNLHAVSNWGDIAGNSPVGMNDTGKTVINYCVPSLGGNCSSGDSGGGVIKPVDRIELLSQVAMHEFGHVLGFRHEHQRTDIPASVATWCKDAQAAARMDVSNGAFIAQGTTNNGISNYQRPYDKDSVMNYCRDQNNDQKPDGYRPWDTVNDQLSAGDQAGAVALYGPLGRRLFLAQDYDGDGRADRVVFRPSTGTWFVRLSAGGADKVVQFGLSTDVLVPGDYDGDRKTDIAVFRPSSGTWFVRASAGGADRVTQFGASTDIPVPGDFDGDGKADPTVFRPSTGTWFSHLSGGGADKVTQFGASTDLPIRGDFDGDGKADPAVFRPSTGTFFAHMSAGGPDLVSPFGTSTDRLVADDYDADGKTDVAVFRPSTGTWFAHLSAGGADLAIQFGASSDRAVRADYDGDGKADPTVYRPSTGTWFVHASAGGPDVVTQFGASTDVIPYQN